jgi:hypothetical protein
MKYLIIILSLNHYKQILRIFYNKKIKDNFKLMPYKIDKN